MGYVTGIAARLSLHVRLSIVIVVTCVLLVSISAATFVYSREQLSTAARRQAENLTLSLTHQATDAIISDDTILLDLVERVAVDGTSPGQVRRLDALARSEVARVPSLHTIFVIDANGTPLISGLPVTPTKLNYRDREDFRFHATHRDRTLFIGVPARSKSDRSWIITLSRRLHDVDGKFAGMASCTISVAYFEKFYESVQLGNGGIINIIRSDGTVLMRAPFNESYLQRNVSNAALFQKYLPRAGNGTYTEASYLDGVRRITAYRRLERFPIVVVVGFAESDVYAYWRSSVAVTVAVVTLLILVIVTLGRSLGREIGKGQQMANELAKLAFRDGLTGVANRRFFDETLEREWRRAGRERTTISLLMIDVDAFKAFNDMHGHQIGDNALVAIAACASNCARRPGDLVARYGGEEFVILLPMTDAVEALSIAEHVRRAVESISIVTRDGLPIGVTISIGASSAVSAASSSATALIGSADGALYQAKHRGRNRTVVSAGHAS